MYANLSNEKFNQMNSLLDKELENLQKIGKNSHSSTLENSESQAKNSPKLDFSDPNSKLQEDLSQLQNKLNFLEQKLSVFSTSSNINIMRDSKFTISNEKPKKGSFFYNNKENDFEINENTPLKQKYEKEKDFELKQAIFTKRDKENHCVNEQQNERKLRENNIKKNINKKIEHSIEKNEKSLNVSRQNLKKSSEKKQKNTSFTPSSRSNQHKNINNSPNDNNSSEITQLKKKILILRKNLDEERNAFLREKQKNREINNDLEKLIKKVKKLEARTEKNAQLESDYLKLMESFEKSENIRKQQKLLIANLKNSKKGVKKK